MASQQPAGSFSLFPNTTRPPSRNQATRPRAQTPQGEPSSTAEGTSPPRNGRETPLGRTMSKREGKQPVPVSQQPAAHPAMSTDGGQPGSSFSFADTAAPSSVQRPRPVVDVPGRCDTAFSEANTLVRSESHSSIAKRPFPDGADGSEQRPSENEPPQALRSMFPTYNPMVPLDRQEYYPTQASPTHIPRGAVSRPLYSPTEPEPQHHSHQQPQQQPRQTHHQPTRTQHNPTASPPIGMATSSHPASPPTQSLSPRAWPPRARPTEPAAVPETSTNADLTGLWKVCSGWKASLSEGRVYCLRMTAEKDTPIYTLSSTTQPFYSLRVEPTSASAYVTLSRHDPLKAPKNAGVPGSITASGAVVEPTKHWAEALSTTLEEPSRRLPPNDGLVALLYPTAAAKMALERPSDLATVVTAERECARLVWDADTGNYYLVHPALAMPFCVTIERSPAWSRTEYTLEHLESPQHLARLTRDGTGEGWMELDTGIAGKIDSCYIVEAAVAALLTVAHLDDKFVNVEVFEPPPVLGGVGRSPRGSISGGSERRGSKLSNRVASIRAGRDGGASGSGGGLGAIFGGPPAEKNKKSKKSKKSKSRMEEFEIDVESGSTNDYWKPLSPQTRRKIKEEKDKLPLVVRCFFALFKCMFQCVVWILQAIVAVVVGCCKCVTCGKI